MALETKMESEFSTTGRGRTAGPGPTWETPIRYLARDPRRCLTERPPRA